VLTACFPRGQPETARDKPQLVLVPMMAGDEVVMRAPFLRLEKFGCPENQPVCLRLQPAIDIHLRGGDAFGASSVGQMAREMSEMEAPRPASPATPQAAEPGSPKSRTEARG